jgi:hypothetical protein
MAPREIAPLGPPPEDFSKRDPIIVSWSEPACRVHRVDLSPVFFGTTGENRFDDPLGPLGTFGVLYVAEDLYGAFAETFGDFPAVTEGALTASGYSTIDFKRSLRLADLRGKGLLRLGADMRLCAGEHKDAQLWARAIWSHEAAVDGLCYPARHDPSRAALAIYDRARDALTSVPGGSLLDPRNRGLTAEILDHYGKGLIAG